MEGLTSPQRKAAANMLALLCHANVSPETFTNLYRQSRENVSEVLDKGNPYELLPSLAIQKAIYKPPEAVYFTDLQRLLEAHRVTRRSFVSALVDHPEGTVVEYPEAGKVAGDAVAHQFTINPTRMLHPKNNIQFSLGDRHGGQDNVTCLLLLDSLSGNPIICKKRTYSCK